MSKLVALELNKLISLEQKPFPFIYRTIMCAEACVCAVIEKIQFVHFSFLKTRKISFYLTSCNSYYCLQTACSICDDPHSSKRS